MNPAFIWINKVLQYTEIDCGIEMWYIKLIQNPYISKQAIFLIAWKGMDNNKNFIS